MAFAQNKNPTFPFQPQTGSVQIAHADAQAQKTVYTAGANGSDVTGLNAVSTDTVARDVQISRTNGGTSYPLGTITVPIGAGNSGSVPSVNLLDPTLIKGLAFDANGNPIIRLVSGDTLTVSALTTVTNPDLITVTATCVEDY